MTPLVHADGTVTSGLSVVRVRGVVKVYYPLVVARIQTSKSSRYGKTRRRRNAHSNNFIPITVLYRNTKKQGGSGEFYRNKRLF